MQVLLLHFFVNAVVTSQRHMFANDFVTVSNFWSGFSYYPLKIVGDTVYKATTVMLMGKGVRQQH